MNNQITEKCAFVSFAVRMFSPERELGRRDKTGAVIKSEKVQIISPKRLAPMNNAKSTGERACRRYGSRLDAMNAWVVPLSNIDALKAELVKSVNHFEAEKANFIANIDSYISAQIAENPADEHDIRSAMPSASDMERSIRISWVRHNLDLDDIEDYGLAREFSGIAEQAAWEIAQDIKTSTGTGTRYTKNTIEVLMRAADKAESFGFLSESLAAIKPAVQQLKASLNVGGFTPADRLMIGAMISFLSDHKKIANEGRHAASVLAPVANNEQQSALEIPVNNREATPESVEHQKHEENEFEYSF